MFGLPPIPSWDGLHPLIVHFPVALLLVAPLFVLLALVRGREGRRYLTAALILMALGTLATYVAIPTGEAAAKLAERTPEINAVIERHESLAEASRLLFTALTVLFAAVLLVPKLLKRELGRLGEGALLVGFLAVYSVGALAIANTAHNGGRLVHEFGVRALMDSPAPPAPQARALGGEGR